MRRALRLPPAETEGRFARPRAATSTLVAVTIIFACGALYAVIARFALDAFPYSGDEYSYVLQAQLFAHGLLKAPAPSHPEWWRVDHVVIDAWVRSKYPPGTALLLSLGVRAGVTWLVTPIEGVIALVALWLATRRLLSEKPALIALVVLGLSPLFALQAATFYSHTATTMFLSLGFATLAAWSCSKRSAWLWLTGVTIGCAFLTRPLDAVLFGLAIASLRSASALAFAGAGAAPFVLLSLLYQRKQFGSLFMDGYRAYRPTFASLYGPTASAPEILPSHLWDPIHLWNHLAAYRAFAIDWTVPGCVLVALVGAFTLRASHSGRPMRTFSITLLGACVSTLLLTNTCPDDGARPRYLSTALIPLAFLVAGGFAPTCAALTARFGSRVRTVVVVLAIAFAPLQLAEFLVGRVPEGRSRESLFRLVEQTNLHQAIVIVRAKYPSRYARNGGLFDAGVLYLSPSAGSSEAEIADAFPNRTVWEAREGDPWTIAKVR